MFSLKITGVPAMAQQVKNPTAGAWVAAEMWVQSLAWELPYEAGCSHLKKEKKRTVDNFKVKLRILRNRSLWDLVYKQFGENSRFEYALHTYWQI